MDINTAIMQRRSIRRFQRKPIEKRVLLDMIALSRLYASGGNLQPIRYVLATNQEKLDAIFDTLRWAAYLPGFQINYDERPMAYIVLTSDKKNCQFDVGAAATTLMLAAEGAGLGTCCLASFDRDEIQRILPLQQDQEPLLVIALGYPAQMSKIVAFEGDIKYFEDADGCLCVPKHTLDEILTVC